MRLPLRTLATVAAAASVGLAALAKVAHAQAAPVSLADYAQSEVRSVRSATPLGAWQAANPRDSIEFYRLNVRQEKESDWCARAIGRVQLDSGRTASRIAYFYAPPARPDAPLPIGVSQPALRSQCRLGMVWTVVLERDIARAEQLTSETRTSLTAALGAGDDVTKLLWLGGARWSQKVLWKSAGIEVVSAMTVREYDNPRDAGPGPPRTLVAIAGDASGVSFVWPTHDPTCGIPSTPRCKEFARLDEAISLASIGGDREAAIRRQSENLERSKDAEPRATPAARRAFLADLTGWVSAARAVPPARRVAALVAADLLLDASYWQMNPGDEADSLSIEMRVRLDSVGAKFIHSPLGGAHVYSHTWLGDALNIGGGGRAHDLAFVTMMERGFETGLCSENRFRTVVSRGTSFLREFPNSTVARDVRLMMARAHGDIVALANGGAYQAADMTLYVPEVPAARERAIADYAAVLGYDDVPSDVRRDAWSSAWRLLAGLPPVKTHFYCVYD